MGRVGRVRVGVLLAFVAVSVAACRPKESTIDLAPRFDLADLVQVAEAPAEATVDSDTQADGPPSALRIQFEDTTPWVRLVLEPEDFQPGPLPGVFVATHPAFALRQAIDADEPAPVLTPLDPDDPRRWRHVEALALTAGGGILLDSLLALRSFALLEDTLTLVEPGAERPPGPLELRIELSRGRFDGNQWWSSLGPLHLVGLPIWPGEQWEHDLPAGSERILHAVLAAEALPSEADPARVRFFALFDGEPLGSWELTLVDTSPAWLPVSIELPSRAGRLALAVEGDPARSVFGAARIEPRRSPSSPPADLAIFLADTFRDDLVGQTVGDLSLTPHLDTFASRATRFERAWSPSSWTLPAHASLFTGLQPTEHGALHRSARLAPEAPTLAARLAALGYRTVALTDAGYVSRAFGIEQGFEFFLEEREWGRLDLGLERLAALLAHGDPRPLFLFFHTYRPHGPFRVDPPTRARFGETLGLGREWEELLDELEGAGWNWARHTPVPEGLDGIVDELLALYRGGAADTDRGFGAFLESLEAHGRGSGFVLFTSDHGEAFAEHDRFFGHAGRLYEEQARVPFLVAGPGIAHGVRRDAATLMDVPRTLFALADLPAHPEWGGRALLPSAPPTAATPLFAQADEIVWVEGDLKLHALGAELERRELYDLAADPGEQRDLSQERAAWAEERIAALLDPPQTWRAARFAVGRSAASAELRNQLEALGYLGD